MTFEENFKELEKQAGKVKLINGQYRIATVTPIRIGKSDSYEFGIKWYLPKNYKDRLKIQKAIDANEVVK